MTEPKHIPLTDHAKAWVDWLADQVPHPIKAALKAYDEAHRIEESDD